MISQLLRVRFSFGLILCKPDMKDFNRSIRLFCPQVNRLAAILKMTRYLPLFMYSVKQLLCCCKSTAVFLIFIFFEGLLGYRFHDNGSHFKDGSQMIKFRRSIIRQSLKTFMSAIQRQIKHYYI